MKSNLRNYFVLVAALNLTACGGLDPRGGPQLDELPMQQVTPPKHPDTTWCEGAWLTDNRCIV